MVARVERHNGVLNVRIDGKYYPPLAFKSFRPNKANISEFYGAGLRLYSILTSGVTSALGVPYSLYGESWIGEGEYDFGPIDRQIELFLENAPEAYFAIMIQLDTRDWYLKLHPEVPNSFLRLSQTAWYEDWRRSAAAYLKAVISHCEAKYGERIFGYFMLCGMTTEWFSAYDREAPHPIKEAGYRKWLGREDACLPSSERMNADGAAFLTPEESDVYMARRFHSDTIAELILYFAREAQTILEHKKLLGLYYGYLLELDQARCHNFGVLEYEKIYTSKDIDMISSPSSYSFRKLRDPSAFMVTQKTLDLHNKLYFLEFDHITHVAPEEVHDGKTVAANGKFVKIPGADSKCVDATESLNLMYRDFLLTTANRAALWWFDMFDGWFRAPELMEAIGHMIAVNRRLSECEVGSVAEIGVFAEGRSLYRVRKSSLLVGHSLSEFRRRLAECGAWYDLCSTVDIGNAELPAYKLFVFCDQYDLPPALRTEILNRLKATDAAALRLYAPSYATDGSLAVSRISELTGIRVVESDAPHGGLVYGGETYSYKTDAPYFAISDRDAVPLAYFEDGSVAVAYTRKAGYLSVYSALPTLPSALLREIARLAGAFIYSERDGVYVYPNTRTIGVYNATDSAAEITLPHAGVYRDLIEGGVYNGESGKLTLPRKPLRAYLLTEEA
ncbi:MAG TPA: hypothetical protein DDW30_07765 [Clostridiales bacterium]|nr:hypothetical protein [Clostridiales bacterium]